MCQKRVYRYVCLFNKYCSTEKRNEKKEDGKKPKQNYIYLIPLNTSLVWHLSMSSTSSPSHHIASHIHEIIGHYWYIVVFHSIAANKLSKHILRTHIFRKGDKREREREKKQRFFLCEMKIIWAFSISKWTLLLLLYM